MISFLAKALIHAFPPFFINIVKKCMSVLGAFNVLLVEIEYGRVKGTDVNEVIKNFPPSGKS